MSGQCLAARWDGVPVESLAFERVAAGLRHRAIDGADGWSAADGTVVMAHQHFWTTPEEVGERQPLLVDDVVVTLDGRLDNRADLAATLGLDASVVAAMSDAALVSELYRRRGEDGLTRLRGAFSVMIWDAAERKLVALRDPLGRRTLFYRVLPGFVVLASEPGAVRAWPGTSDTLDEVFLAHYFALYSPPAGKTLFAAITELMPGRMMVVNEAGARLVRYWSPRLETLRYRDDDQYGEAFVALLDEAVRQRRRSVAEPGVMMSGGLDSTAVAALATLQLRTEQSDARLKVFSYVFNEMPDLDERRWMAPMVARYELDQTQVVVDDAWPLYDVADWRWNPSGPDGSPFRPLNERLFAAATGAGRRVLLTGAASDGLFLGLEAWLADLVADGRYRDALSQMAKYIRGAGLRRVLRSRSVRRLAASLVGWPGRPHPAPPWLTPSAAARLMPSDGIATGARPKRRPADIQLVLEAVIEEDGIDGGYLTHQCGVDVRDPFSAVPLVEFILSIPAYMLYYRGQVKYVLRQGVRSCLPPELLRRVRRSNLWPLYRHGMVEREPALVDRLLGEQDALWRQHVRPDAVSNWRARLDGRASDVVLWKCISMQWWIDRRDEIIRSGDRSTAQRNYAAA